MINYGKHRVCGYSFLAVLLAMGVGWQIANNKLTSAVVIVVVIYLTVSLLKSLDNGILFAFSILPFLNSPLVNNNLAGIPGAKPLNLFLLILLLLSVNNLKKRKFSFTQKRIHRKTWFFVCVYCFIFAVAITRSFQYLPILHKHFPLNFQTDPIRFILSFGVTPLLYISLLLYVATIARKEMVPKIFNSLVFSVFLLSLYVVLVHIFNPGLITDHHMAISTYQSQLGYYYGTIATYLLSGFPLVLFFVSKNKRIGSFFVVVVLLAILLLKARTAYLSVIISSAFYLYMTKQKKVLVMALIASVLIFLVGVVPDSITNRIMQGITPGGQIDIYQITSGRISTMWAPLFFEVLHDPYQLFLGKCRFANITSDLYQLNLIYHAVTPHNSFLEMLLDSGIIILSLFLYYLIKFLVYYYQFSLKHNSKLCFSLLAALLAYFLACFTGRSFFPSYHFLYIYIVIGLMIATLKLSSVDADISDNMQKPPE